MFLKTNQRIHLKMKHKSLKHHNPKRLLNLNHHNQHQNQNKTIMALVYVPNKLKEQEPVIVHKTSH